MGLFALTMFAHTSEDGFSNFDSQTVWEQTYKHLYFSSNELHEGVCPLVDAEECRAWRLTPEWYCITRRSQRFGCFWKCSLDNANLGTAHNHHVGRSFGFGHNSVSLVGPFFQQRTQIERNRCTDSLWRQKTKQNPSLTRKFNQRFTDDPVICHTGQARTKPVVKSSSPLHIWRCTLVQQIPCENKTRMNQGRKNTKIVESCFRGQNLLGLRTNRGVSCSLLFSDTQQRVLCGSAHIHWPQNPNVPVFIRFINAFIWMSAGAWQLPYLIHLGQRGLPGKRLNFEWEQHSPVVCWSRSTTGHQENSTNAFRTSTWPHCCRSEFTN